MPDSRPSSAISAELTALVTDLQRNPADVDQCLAELIETAPQVVPGAQYAGITLAHRVAGISTPAATHRYPVLLDKIQQQHQEGPCLSVAWEHHIMRIDDLAAETRWPRYTRQAVAETPIRSTVSFELSVTSHSLSALNFHAEQPRAFDHESIELGLIFATHIALAWTMLRRDEQFRSALASQDIIGQAKGILMERFNLDAVAAFGLLTRLSQQTNTKLADLAQRLVDVEHPALQAPPKTTRGPQEQDRTAPEESRGGSIN